MGEGEAIPWGKRCVLPKEVLSASESSSHAQVVLSTARIDTAGWHDVDLRRSRAHTKLALRR